MIRKAPFKAALWSLGGSIFFSILMLLNKYARHSIPLPLVVWGRCAFALLFLVPFMNFQGIFHQWKTQLLRGILVSSAMICTYSAYRHLPTHTASILGTTGPLFTVFLAILFLKESVHWQRWLCVILGWLGALIVLDPMNSTSGLLTYKVIALLGNLAAASVIIYARFLSEKRIAPETTLFYGLGVPFVAYTLQLPYVWEPIDYKAWLVLGILGMAGGLSSWCHLKSLQLAPASFVAPFDYVRLCILIPCAYYFWGEVPSWSFYIGSAFIILALLILLHLDRKHSFH